MVGSLSCSFSISGTKVDVEEHQPVFGMIGDIGDLVGEQARIDGVIDRADAGDAVPGLQVPPGVPGERRDAVAELHALLLKPLRHFSARPRISR